MKKGIVVLVLASFISAPLAYSEPQTPAQTSTPSADTASVAPKQAGPVKRTPDGKPILEEGTPVRLRITRTISSADAKTGDRVDFEVLDAIKLGDIEVIPQGGIAWGTVTEAQAKRRMARGGKLNVNIDAVKLANGERAGLRAVKENKGGGHVGAMTGAMVATGLVFFPAAPLFLFMHGKDITVPKGTEITAYINADTPYNVPVSEPSASSPTPQAATPASAEVEVVSTPDAADIEVDGAFSGNTPSKISLASGDHTITVKKAGYQVWERKVHLSSGHITLKADLQAAAQ
jgi:hypothetical protein